MTARDAVEGLKTYAGDLPSVQLSARSVCDLELLATGAFSPLDRFMGSADYKHVLEEMRLASGFVFPFPITLPVEPSTTIQPGRDITLRDAWNNVLAVMSIEEVYEWDMAETAQK